MDDCDSAASAGLVVESILAGELSPALWADEPAWHRLWVSRDLGALSPVGMALTGGALADRLPWVFVAGYQAALRAVFPALPTSGWGAFVATEDQSDPREHPGVLITESAQGWELNGHKSWVAQSRHVAHLIVTARKRPDGEFTCCVLVSADAPGVHLSHRDSPAFLADMSQGFACFISVSGSEVPFEFERSRAFGRSEARFVMLSASAFLLAQQVRVGMVDDETVALVCGLATLCEENEVTARALATFDRSLSGCVSRFDARGEDAVPGWRTDRRLLSMYSQRIQRRAERATSQGG